MSRISPIASWLDLAHVAEESVEQLTADVYMSIDVIALPVAFRLRELTGGRVYCDVKESASLGERSLPSTLSPLNLAFLDQAFGGYLRKCDHRFTVGWTLGSDLAEQGVDAEVLPNYRIYTRPQPDGWLRRRIGVADDVPIVLAINNIVSDAEQVISAVGAIERAHLVVLGAIKPPAYQAEVHEFIKAKGLTDRVHVLEPVPYDRLIHVAAEADVGLILLDNSIPNHRVSLPNRIFDLIGAHLPVVSPRVPDIATIIDSHECGVVIDDQTAAGWERGIRDALERRSRLHDRAANAALALDWSTNEQQLLRQFDGVATVTLVHHRNLHIHQRTIRIAGTLARAGIHVRFATAVTTPVPTDFPYEVIDLSS